MNPLEKMILTKIGDEAIARIKALNPTEIAAFVRHLFLEYADGLLTDTDGDGKTQIENAMEEIEEGIEHLKAAARLLQGAKK